MTEPTLAEDLWAAVGMARTSSQMLTATAVKDELAALAKRLEDAVPVIEAAVALAAEATHSDHVALRVLAQRHGFLHDTPDDPFLDGTITNKGRQLVALAREDGK